MNMQYCRLAVSKRSQRPIDRGSKFVGLADAAMQRRATIALGHG